MKTIKYQLFVLLIILLSCKKEENISLKILNEDLHYSLNLDSLITFNKKFPSELSRDESTNVVTFNLENNTSKRQLFFIKDLYLINLFALQMRIFENDKEIEIGTSYITPYFENDSIFKAVLVKEYYSYYLQKKDEKLLEKVGFMGDNFLVNKKLFDQYVILNSGESRTFKTTVSLPFVFEHTLDEVNAPKSYIFKENKEYKFSVSYNFDKDFESSLPAYFIEDLKKNNIEIFKGKIESNKVPIKNNYKTRCAL